MKFGAAEDAAGSRSGFTAESSDADEALMDVVPSRPFSALANARSTHMPVSCLNPALFGRTSSERMSR